MAIYRALHIGLYRIRYLRPYIGFEFTKDTSTGGTFQPEGEKKAATDVRESENAEYQKMSTDFGESVDALERAVQVIKDALVN